jgi:hypothetical protein
MVRMVNLVVEVFIDIDENGTAHAEAILLHNADKRLLARGTADVGPPTDSGDPVEGDQVAAYALADLAEQLLHKGTDDDRRSRPPPVRDRCGCYGGRVPPRARWTRRARTPPVVVYRGATSR